jgi:hypothetical protein
LLGTNALASYNSKLSDKYGLVGGVTGSGYNLLHLSTLAVLSYYLLTGIKAAPTILFINDSYSFLARSLPILIAALPEQFSLLINVDLLIELAAFKLAHST